MTEADLSTVIRAIAPVVRDCVAKAVGELAPRLAVAEARLATLHAAEQALSEVRDRLVGLEVKAALPVPAAVVVEPVDLSPVLERVAAAEARLATLGDLRDRVVTVETKAANVVPVVPVEPVTVDLSPVLERVAAAEARLSVLGDLRDRVVTVETKAAMPLPADPAIGELREKVQSYTAGMWAVENTQIDHVKKRIEALEQREVVAPPSQDIADLRDRIMTLETRSAGPSVTDMAMVDVRQQLNTLQDRVRNDTPTMALGSLSERIAVLETRAPVPGPAGKDGKDGKDGVDGLSFDDFEEVQDDDGRTVTRRYRLGERVKEFVHKTAVELYRGVWIEGKTYDRGDGVTWGGSEWHCNEATTTKPGEGSKAWRLKVKRGRDGKDGRDAQNALPVVSVGRA